PAMCGGRTRRLRTRAPDGDPAPRPPHIRPRQRPASESCRRAKARESGSAAYVRRAYHLRLEARMRSGTRVVIGAALVALAVGAPWPRAAAQPPAPAADLLLVNASVLTVDGADSIAQAIAISGGKIVAVGTNEQ